MIASPPPSGSARRAMRSSNLYPVALFETPISRTGLNFAVFPSCGTNSTRSCDCFFNLSPNVCCFAIFSTYKCLLTPILGDGTRQTPRAAIGFRTGITHTTDNALGIRPIFESRLIQIHAARSKASNLGFQTSSLKRFKIVSRAALPKVRRNSLSSASSAM